EPGPPLRPHLRRHRPHRPAPRRHAGGRLPRPGRGGAGGAVRLHAAHRGGGQAPPHGGRRDLPRPAGAPRAAGARLPGARRARALARAALPGAQRRAHLPRGAGRGAGARRAGADHAGPRRAHRGRPRARRERGRRRVLPRAPQARRRLDCDAAAGGSSCYCPGLVSRRARALGAVRGGGRGAGAAGPGAALPGHRPVAALRFRAHAVRRL
ncbi:MAG: hypothetical protein AVDCRST_MAG40-2355, partial [uncultured Gemmatimonadaceae bacterium]